jgi:hypothetical protein
VAAAYNNMGFVMQAQGELDEALEWYEISLKHYKKSLGKDHVSISKTHVSIATGSFQEETWRATLCRGHDIQEYGYGTGEASRLGRSYGILYELC